MARYYEELEGYPRSAAAVGKALAAVGVAVALARTEANGGFSFMFIPVGQFSLEASAPLVNGLARLNSRVSFNLQTQNLGE
jgi:hypothetical protein